MYIMIRELSAFFNSKNGKIKPKTKICYIFAQYKQVIVIFEL